ncbi:MAG: hypothetical protein LUE14_07915 [Clostridiales bacterium]|nr:hypothetical protein [Clostridiales bacterium]
MRNTRRFTVSDFLLPYVIKVLERDDVPFVVVGDGENGKQQVEVPLSGNQFHIVVEDARCEVQREKTNPEIPVYSYRTLIKDGAKWRRLVKINGKHGFHILRSDLEKTLEAFGCDYLVPELDEFNDRHVRLRTTQREEYHYESKNRKKEQKS